MYEVILIALGAGSVLAALACVFIYVLTDEQRGYLRANFWPPKSPDLATSAASAGNVSVKVGEWNRAPDGPVYTFPDMDDPVTRYENLNRRLIIFKKAEQRLLSGIPPRNVSDHAQTLQCLETDMLEAVERDLVPTHHVIFDPTGHFAQVSQRLNFSPLLHDPFLDEYLKLPRENRPVIVSYDPPLKDAAQLVFRRWGFEGAPVDIRYLTPYPRQSFGYVLQKFIGTSDAWLWFSTARLRDFVVNANAPSEHRIAAIAQELQENRFARLWALRDESILPDVLDEPEDPVQASAA